MPRWKPRHRGRPNGGTERHADGSSTSSPAWTWVERKELQAYLSDYRDKALLVYQQSSVPSSKRRNSGADNNSSIEAAIRSNSSARKIGEVEFPALTEQVLTRPYLALPRTLSPKQRRMVHDCCVEADLYHASVGHNKTDRYLVISMYVDGFDSIVELYQPYQLALHKFRPWVCRQSSSSSNSPSPEETAARRSIEALIDQPGDSLRDEIDSLQIDELQHKSLAHIIPPRYGPDADTWMLVDTPAKMKQCVVELTAANPTCIAFDLEAYNQSKYAQMTCLLQLATDVMDKEYVIDPLAEGVWEEVHRLAPLFGDPSIVKIGHSIGGLDVCSLHRDFGIFIVNAFDTYEASRVLRLPSGDGLAAVCEYYGLPDSATYKSLKALYQVCDWTVRPLTHPMLQYARYDVHYLIPLREIMIRDLTRDAWNSHHHPNGLSTAAAQLWANSLAETLKHFGRQEELLEEKGGLVEGVGSGSNDDDDILQDEEVNEELGADDDDSGSFQTTLEFRAGTSEQFFTPRGSVVGDGNSTIAGEEEDDVDDEVKSLQPPAGMDSEPRSKLEVSVLRLQIDLMRTITNSHERCLQVWKSHQEPHMQNAHLASLIHRARRGEVDWTVSRTRLYNSLVEWRSRVAEELECLPAWVATLQFLLTLALKQPMNEASLRRISHYLPPLFEENKEYREQVLSIIRASCEEESLTETNEHASYYYANFGVAAEGVHRNRDQTNVDDDSSQNPGSEIVWKLCVVGAVIAGAAIAILAARRRRR